MRILLLATWIAAVTLGNDTPAHPLDPLTRAEIEASVAVVKSSGKLTETSRFHYLGLKEPAKREVLAFRPGGALRRQAEAVIYDRAANRTYEATIDLTAKSLASWTHIPGAQPSILDEEMGLFQEIVQADAGWQAAMRKRGITDLKSVQVDPWSPGHFDLPGEAGARMLRGISHYRDKSQNPWARPIEGVVAYVDLNAKKVVKLIDTGVVAVAKGTGEYDPKAVGAMRAAPKPLTISQPAGPSFTREGNEVHWQKWRFRYGYNPREGLVLYTVGYEDEGRLRPVMYRAALSEMVVPYGDPGPAWFFRNAFDEGEYDIGRLANSLEPLNDAPPNAVFAEVVFAGEQGQTVETPRAIAIYERDGGLLWKHQDFLTKAVESRRARQLVISWIATVGNYEYGFNWIFHQDGMLEMDALLTGIMQTKGVSGSHHADHHHLVAEGVAAVHHQHFLNFRLDMDVDASDGNSVVELNTEAMPAGPDNPYRNGIVMRETVLGSERQAQRQVSLAASRKWKVISTRAKNALGQPTGYVLVPGENAVPYAHPESSVRKRAGFLSAHLWATPYTEGEIHAAGSYINQSRGGEGLAKWTAGDRALAGKDVVLWYTMGVTHIPRPEDWPVMPVHHTGFKLMPSGFFLRNPGLDVPRTE